jgi:KipI family sensor histidine kinase inhibitor
MYDKPMYIPEGDQSLVVEMGDDISPETNRRVHDLLRAIERQRPPGVVDLIPTYRSLLVQYDPLRVSFPDLKESVSQLEGGLDEDRTEKHKVVPIPTLYEGEFAPDLPSVAEHADLTREDVVRLHSEPDYLIYMIGFTPGFPYLGGLPEKLAMPRLADPRTNIPAGSVGIAESQTGIYPVASPGGWRIIGRTPLRLFDPQRDPPSLLAAGDYVRFVPLSSEEEYARIREQVDRGTHKLEPVMFT